MNWPPSLSQSVVCLKSRTEAIILSAIISQSFFSQNRQHCPFESLRGVFGHECQKFINPTGRIEVDFTFVGFFAGNTRGVIGEASPIIGDGEGDGGSICDSFCDPCAIPVRSVCDDPHRALLPLTPASDLACIIFFALSTSFSTRSCLHRPAPILKKGAIAQRYVCQSLCDAFAILAKVASLSGKAPPLRQ